MEISLNGDFTRTHDFVSGMTDEDLT